CNMAAASSGPGPIWRRANLSGWGRKSLGGGVGLECAVKSLTGASDTSIGGNYDPPLPKQVRFGRRRGLSRKLNPVALLEGQKHDRILVFDEDSVFGRDGVGVSWGIGDLDPSQLGECFVGWLKGDQLGGWGQGQQNGTGIDNRSIATSPHATAASFGRSLGGGR